LAALCGGALACGVVHALLSRFVGRVRFALPPMITGSVVLMIGLSLMKIGIEYAAGGVPAIGTPAFGAPQSWLLAGVVVAATLALKFFGRGM
ncbi:solute carrier family 23 protein, partial [Salmonella enterica]|uniref:solute carrier family 23 protein n=1 Tax=Salmonella enterica TaxID=28901 RepID=UPI003D2686A5